MRNFQRTKRTGKLCAESINHFQNNIFQEYTAEKT